MLSLLLVLFHNREDNMEEHEERSSKLWYSLPNFSMAMSIRVVGLDAPCKPRTWSTSSCSFHKLPKKDRIDFKCERRLQETMFFAMKILRVWEVKLQEVMVYDQNLGTMNHRDKRDRKPWSWSITNLGISCQRKPVVSAESIHSPLHLFFLGHCTSSFRHGSKLVADESDGLTISSSKALQLLTAAPHFYMLLKFHEILIFAAEDITMVVCLWYTQWCLLFHHPICVHVLGISTATCCLRTP